MKKIPYILALIAVVIIGAVVWITVGHDGNPVSSTTPEPSAQGTASASPQPGQSTSPKPGTSGFIGLTGLKEPATCTVGGTVEFLKPNLFSSSENTKITWKNVDIQSRQIHWKITPNDALSVGPNIFANLSVPDGSENLTVGLPAKPVAKSYKLTASVTYGQMVNGNAVVKEAACSGSTTVRLKY